MIQFNPDVVVRIGDTEEFRAEGWFFANVVVQVPADNGKAIQSVDARVQVLADPALPLTEVRQASIQQAVQVLENAITRLRQELPQ